MTKKKCGSCGNIGHNARTCPDSIVTTMLFGESAAEDEEEDVVAVETDQWVDIPLSEEVVGKFSSVIEMCTAVSTELKKGFGEGVYEEAMCVELQLRNIQFTTQETLPIMYKGRFVGNNRLDIIVHDWLPLIIELKATAAIKNADRWQVVRYMSRKDVPFGVVINFSQTVKGSLYISFIVKHEGDYYQYSPETKQGKKMIDY